LQREFSKTALFLFTSTPTQEVQVKSFAHDQAKNLQIAKTLVSRAENSIKHIGIDYFIINSTNQQGINFGERLGNAFQFVFDEGYKKVICIGSDCPALTSQLLHRAIKKLEINGSVLGPAKDGGVYLIGLSREHFHKTKFASIHWQTDQVAGQLDNYLRHKGSVFFLPLLADIDNAADILNAIHQYGYHSIFRTLKAILFSLSINRITPFAEPFYSIPLFSFGLKAPPLS
jgi:uncharacterized protein